MWKQKIGAYGFQQIIDNDDWARPIANDFSERCGRAHHAVSEYNEGTVYQPEDDADGNSANGFQVEAAIGVDPLAPLEAGQEITVLANGTPASTTPSPFLMGADPSASQSFALTLAGGPQALTVTAQDACGNQSPDQDAITVTLDVDGCPSRFAGFANNPQILNAAAGQVVGGSLGWISRRKLTILMLDVLAEPPTSRGRQCRSIISVWDGSLSFTGIGLAPGSRNLRLRVSAAGLDTVDSQVQVVTVDIDTPSISFVSPTDNSAILSDADSASDNGQQVTIIGTVTEPSVATSRTVTLSIDGSLVDSAVVGNGASEQVNFVDQTLTSGLLH